MTVTYSTDAQVITECPQASSAHAKSLLASGDTLDRVRVLVESRINRELERRGIEPTDLSIPSQVTSCEVYGVLAELHFKSASRAGLDGQDWYTQEGKRYITMYEHELLYPFSVDGDVATVPTIRLRRG